MVLKRNYKISTNTQINTLDIEDDDLLYCIQPIKQSMRMHYANERPRHRGWEAANCGTSRTEKRNALIDKLYGHIDKYVGRKFDECFNDLKNKFNTNKDWQVQCNGVGSHYHKNKKFLWKCVQEFFLDIFNNEYYRRNKYSIVDGIIVLDKRKNNIIRHNVVQYAAGEYYYRVKHTCVNRCLKVFSTLSDELFNEIQHHNIISPKIFNDVKHEFYSQTTRFEQIGSNDLFFNVYIILSYQSDIKIKPYPNVRNIIDYMMEYCFECVDNREQIITSVSKRKYKKSKLRNKK